MGFRIGWWGKRGGVTWGPAGGFRLTGYSGRRGRSSSGCLVPFVFGVGSILAVVLSFVVN